MSHEQISTKRSTPWIATCIHISKTHEPLKRNIEKVSHISEHIDLHVRIGGLVVWETKPCLVPLVIVLVLVVRIAASVPGVKRGNRVVRLNMSTMATLRTGVALSVRTGVLSSIRSSAEFG